MKVAVVRGVALYSLVHRYKMHSATSQKIILRQQCVTHMISWNIIIHMNPTSSQGQLSSSIWCSESLQGHEVFIFLFKTNVYEGFGVHPASSSMGVKGSFPRSKAASVKFITQLNPLPIFRMSIFNLKSTCVLEVGRHLNSLGVRASCCWTASAF